MMMMCSGEIYINEYGHYSVKQRKTDLILTFCQFKLLGINFDEFWITQNIKLFLLKMWLKMFASNGLCSTDLWCMVINKIIKITNYWGPDLQLLTFLICADLDPFTDLQAMLLQSSCHCPALADQLTIGRLFAVFPADLQSERKSIFNCCNRRGCWKKAHELLAHLPLGERAVIS